MLAAKKRVEKTNLIFCGFSKISDLSSPLGKRNGISCQESQQGQQWQHGVSFKNSHSVCLCSLCPVTVPDACDTEIQLPTITEILSLMMQNIGIKRDYRERASIGVTFVHRHVARHWTCYPFCHIQPFRK